jgi:hypothetical protein
VTVAIEEEVEAGARAELEQAHRQGEGIGRGEKPGHQGRGTADFVGLRSIGEEAVDRRLLANQERRGRGPEHALLRKRSRGVERGERDRFATADEKVKGAGDAGGNVVRLRRRVSPPVEDAPADPARPIEALAEELDEPGRERRAEAFAPARLRGERSADGLLAHQPLKVAPSFSAAATILSATA